MILISTTKYSKYLQNQQIRVAGNVTQLRYTSKRSEIFAKLARRSPQTTYSGRFKDRIASSGVKACKQNPVPVSRRFRTTRRMFSAKLPADPGKA